MNWSDWNIDPARLADAFVYDPQAPLIFSSGLFVWLFAALVLIRPVNILVKKVLSLICGCGPEGRHYGALTGAVERILYAAMVFYGSWIAFAIIYFAKCALFCLRIKNDPETGMRLYLGSLLSALSVIPVALTAASFI